MKFPQLLARRILTDVTSMPVSMFFFAGAALMLGVELPAHACEGEAHADEGKPTLTVSQLSQPSAKGAQRALLQVKGMSCGSCEKAISAQLKKIEGVITVSFRKGKDSEGGRVAEVSYSPGVKVTTAALIQAVEKAGYHASAAQ